jgi:putative sigma-54 modulation protein
VKKEKSMELDVQGRNLPLSDALLAYTTRRIGFAFDLLADRIRQIVVRFSDDNGPHGGADTRCQVSVRFRGGNPLILQDTDTSAYRAVDRTISRLKPVVRQELKRRRVERRRACRMP